jgi:glycosyltransferase involved in cell wall biosynthesis
VSEAPRITVGVPVRNGERHLGDALASILGQSLRDLEVVICDNASTDRTPELCRAAARRDVRIRLERSEEDIGAAPNFDRVLALARGRYFTWWSHDDVREPTQLEHAAAVLDREPGVALCHGAVWPIDDTGAPLRPDLAGCPRGEVDAALAYAGLADPPRRLDHPAPEVRFRDAVLRTRWCYEIFGVARTDTLRASAGMQSFYGSDQTLLAELCLAGRVVRLPGARFLRRFHAGTSTAMRSGPGRDAWIDPNARPARLPAARFVRSFARAVRRARLGPRQRLACRVAIARWCLQPARWSRVLGKLAPRRSGPTP